jgi:hypothetical protein
MQIVQGLLLRTRAQMVYVRILSPVNFVYLTLNVSQIIISVIIINIRPLLWSTGQSSWLQAQRSGFDSQRYQIF